MYQHEVSNPVKHWQPDEDKRLLELEACSRVNLYLPQHRHDRFYRVPLLSHCNLL